MSTRPDAPPIPVLRGTRTVVAESVSRGRIGIGLLLSVLCASAPSHGQQKPHEETDAGTRFTVRIDSPNRLILTQAYYAYCDDVPYWRDLMWYPTLLYRRADGVHEGYVHGKTPDAAES